MKSERSISVILSPSVKVAGVCRSIQQGTLGYCTVLNGASSIALLALALTAILGCTAFGQANNAALELKELRAALTFAEQQNTALRKQNAEYKKSIAEGFRVSEEQGVRALKLQEKLEALGVDLLSSDKNQLEQRLLKAVRDLDISRQESERRRKAIQELSESFLNFLAATPQANENAKAEAQKSIATAGKALNELVDPTQVVVRDLQKSEVVSFDPGLSLLVLNSGRKSGVRIGTPVEVLRDGQPIFSAQIIKVHDSICGALLLEDLAQAGPPKVGDRIRPIAKRINF